MGGCLSSRILRASVGVISMFVCVTGRAGEPSAAQKADEIYRIAQQRLREGDFEGARWLFAESYVLDPATGPLINVALCDEQLGHVASAWMLYGEAAREAEEKHESDRVEMAAARAQKLEPLLPRLTIEVAPPSGGGRIELSVDRWRIATDAAGAVLTVDPGDHEVEAHGEGLRPWADHVHVEAGGQASVQVPPLTPVARATSLWGPAAWVASGAGVAALGVGAAYGIAGLVNRGTYMSNKNCLGGTADCNPTGMAAATRARSDFQVADVSYAIGGGLMLAAGALWWVARRHNQREEPARTGIVVRPMVSANSWVLSLDDAW